jgi:hypothetical protein
MEPEYIRDYVTYTAFLGMFSFVWFGWAQENPRENWRKYTGVAVVSMPHWRVLKRDALGCGYYFVRKGHV